MIAFIKVRQRLIKQDKLKTINLMGRVIYNLLMEKFKMVISKKETLQPKNRLKIKKKL